MHCEPLREVPSASVVAAVLVGRRGAAWLDGRSGERMGAWSFVAWEPRTVRNIAFDELDSFAPLDALAIPNKSDTTGEIHGLPLARVPAWIGCVAYDAFWAIERRMARKLERDPKKCVLWFGYYDAVLAIHHDSNAAWIVGDDRQACARMKEAIVHASTSAEIRAVGARRIEAEDPNVHRAAIRAALESIARGDIYQVNLARRWTAELDGTPLPLWLAMRRTSPVPLGFYLDTGSFAVLSRTMETFLTWRGPGEGLVTRPIKGTVARSEHDTERAAHALSTNTKERAEHAMIVDLMRNDVGRVARTGSVEVLESMLVEPYAGLSHLVSTVACRTRPDVTLAQIFEAMFPPGSVTGAPKLRAMQIIEQLERHPRDFYTGCVGYIDRGGGASFAVTIRTVSIEGPSVVYWSGGGIVSASDIEAELAETELKARVFLHALNEC